jgi:PGF-pre-PGF domain-containing protein
MPENWEPREDWLPPEEWIPPEPPAYVCPIDGMEFDTAAELDAHHASAHPDVKHPCPFCGETFGAITPLETHFEVFHEDEIPTPDQIPGHLDLFIPPPLLKPPPEWEDFQLPPLENLPLFIPPWLDPEENHWVPPENVPFWAWELDNILPGAEVSIYTPADMLPQMNLGGGTWVSVEVVVEVAHVGGIQLEIDPELDAPLDDVVVTALNLEELPEGVLPPDENFFEPIRIGTNIAEYIENAEVGFKVNRDWIAANNLDENSIRLEHYVQGAWTELPTRITGRDENYVYCSAEGVPSFSVFAITADPVAPPPEEVPPEEVPPVVLPLELIVVVVIVLLLVIAGGILKRRR